MTLAIHVGRLHTRHDGYEIRLSDGTVVLGPGGRGLTAREAELVLDEIEERNTSRLSAYARADVEPRRKEAVGCV